MRHATIEYLFVSCRPVVLPSTRRLGTRPPSTLRKGANGLGNDGSMGMIPSSRTSRREIRVCACPRKCAIESARRARMGLAVRPRSGNHRRRRRRRRRRVAHVSLVRSFVPLPFDATLNRSRPCCALSTHRQNHRRSRVSHYHAYPSLGGRRALDGRRRGGVSHTRKGSWRDFRCSDESFIPPFGSTLSLFLAAEPLPAALVSVTSGADLPSSSRPMGHSLGGEGPHTFSLCPSLGRTANGGGTLPYLPGSRR
jgi:hypothetical protein